MCDVNFILEDLRASESNAARLCVGLSNQQANWQPNAGRSWSIVQCLRHLAIMNRVYSAEMQKAVTAAAAQRTRPRSSAISPGWLGRWFIASMEPPVRTRMKSPERTTPSAEGDLAETLQEFIASHEPIRAVLETSAELDLNRVRYKNPFVPLLRFTMGTGLLIINAHDRRHLWQVNQVREARGFPKD